MYVWQRWCPWQLKFDVGLECDYGLANPGKNAHFRHVDDIMVKSQGSIVYFSAYLFLPVAIFFPFLICSAANT